MKRDERGTILSPNKAFAVLGNETRMAILQALWSAERPLTFSELRSRVGVGDSGKFNYHLGRLDGHFVHQAADGYLLQAAGEHVIRAVLAGAITQNPSFEPSILDAKCPYCGGAVEAWYANETFTARCTECVGIIESEDYPAGTFMHYSIPPAALLNRSPDDVYTVAHVLYDAKLTAMLEQVCPECAAEVEFEFDVCSDHEVPDGGLCPRCGTRSKVWVRATCRNCRYRRLFLAWFAVATNPAVIAFYYEQAVPWDRVPFSKLTWENTPYVAGIEEELIAEDPLTIRVTIPAADDALHISIDADLNVLDVTREGLRRDRPSDANHSPSRSLR